MIVSRSGFGGAILAISISLTVWISAAKPTAAADELRLALEQRLDALVPGLLEEYKVPGVAVTVIDGEVTLVRGYGLRRNRSPEPVGPDTVFDAASLGKPVFAYAMMKRVAAGQFDLDRPLSANLDVPYIEDDARIHRITARHVLSHTTGFPNWRPKHHSDQPGALRILREPGSAFGYSGEGYMYLQAVTERETDEALDTILQASVLEPLGMTRSSYIWSDDFAPDFAMPHGWWGQVGNKRRPRQAGAAFSLHTTASDFARFLGAMMADNAKVAEAMLAPQIEFSDERHFAWSLGWGIERRPDGDWFWQWGDNDGFKHFVMGSRTEDRAVLVLTNARRGAHVYRAVVETVLGFLPKALELEYIRY